MKDSEKVKILYDVILDEARKARMRLSRSISEINHIKHQYDNWVQEDDGYGNLGWDNGNPHAASLSKAEEERRQAQEQDERWREVHAFMIEQFCKKFDVETVDK